MSEAPLNALTDPHSFKGAAQRTLDRVNRLIQTPGWWFNREKLTLQPSAEDSGLYLPGDAISVITPKPNYVQRGRRLYNTDGGTYVFTNEVCVQIIRLVPFEDLPEIAAQYISSVTVLQFQSNFDGDTQRRKELTDRIGEPSGKLGTLPAFMAQEIRHTKANLITSNSKLMRLKEITNGARRHIRV